MDYFHLGDKRLTIDNLSQVLKEFPKVQLSERGKSNIAYSRNWLESHIEQMDEPVYGINTGFGSLCNIQISDEDLGQLQTNLVRSHNCGTGEEVPADIVRLMLLLKIHSFAYGYSGIRLETVERLVTFYNEDALPVIYEFGSLGASGDLAPLAAMSMPLLGEGKMRFKGELMEAEEVHEKLGLQPLTLKAKEGLALLNGTQFMAAYGVFALIKCREYFSKANLVGAASIDGFNCKASPFSPLIQNIRGQKGQMRAAEMVRNILGDSPTFNSPKEHVQDPYSFRCLPQVHGASYDVYEHVRGVVEDEINAVTDNPTVFARQEKVLSGGNFHGQPLAMALDYLAIAYAELGSISERRSYNLLSGGRGLPEFLTPKPGLNSGLMIPQYTAATLVNRNKQLCSPASADTIPSSNGQEDHVSMGANSAVKLYELASNVVKILGIEWLLACQAMHCRENIGSSSIIEELKENFAAEVPPLKDDRDLGPEMEKSRAFLEALNIEKYDI